MKNTNKVTIPNYEKFPEKFPFSQGDIITTNARNNASFTHTGLVVDERGELKVVHNAPDNMNPWGGTVAVESLESYLMGRDLISTEPSGLTDHDIRSGIEAVKTKRFSLTAFNCEHFISFMRNRFSPPFSPQLLQFMRLIGGGLAGPLMVYAGIRMRSRLLIMAGTLTILYNGWRYISTDLQRSHSLADSMHNLVDNVTLGKYYKSVNPVFDLNYRVRAVSLDVIRDVQVKDLILKKTS